MRFHSGGDIAKFEIRDITRRKLYFKKFDIHNKQEILNHLGILEEFSGLSIATLLKEKLRLDEWI